MAWRMTLRMADSEVTEEQLSCGLSEPDSLANLPLLQELHQPAAPVNTCSRHTLAFNEMPNIQEENISSWHEGKELPHFNPTLWSLHRDRKSHTVSGVTNSRLYASLPTCHSCVGSLTMSASWPDLGQSLSGGPGQFSTLSGLPCSGVPQGEASIHQFSEQEPFHNLNYHEVNIPPCVC